MACFLLIIVWAAAIYFAGKSNNLCFGIIGILMSFFIVFPMNYFHQLVQDISCKQRWQKSQKRLEREGKLTKTTPVRISFAYLYQIKVGDKYLLVPNMRNTGKYQPVGGVYKMKAKEKEVLSVKFHIIDDDKIMPDVASRNDYRLKMRNEYLRKFVRRFNKTSDREKIENLGREFKEELLYTGILDWKTITYRYCGRHMSDLKFSDHFQIYELLLADIVELLPTEEQERDLKEMMAVKTELYAFATAEEIQSLGIDTNRGELHEWIADHSMKILQENESTLLKMKNTGKKYTVSL